MVYAQLRICPAEWDAETPLGFWDPNGSPNLGQKTRPYNNQQKERTCRTVDVAVPKRTNHIKEGIDKTQQNSKCRLRGDRYEIINHIISVCSKLSQT